MIRDGYNAGIKKESKKFGISFDLHYLFALREDTSVRKYKEKQVFLWYFAHLFVSLHPEGCEAACVLTPEGMSVAFSL
jgi:hypothetical protein